MGASLAQWLDSQKPRTKASQAPALLTQLGPDMLSGLIQT